MRYCNRDIIKVRQLPGLGNPTRTRFILKFFGTYDRVWPHPIVALHLEDHLSGTTFFRLVITLVVFGMRRPTFRWSLSNLFFLRLLNKPMYEKYRVSRGYQNKDVGTPPQL